MRGVYIHIPFCAKKCKYCDFVSFPEKDDIKNGYIDKLISEIAEYSGEKADTIFIGGGTPTVLSASQLERVLFAVKRNFDISEKAEYTIEANPKTLDEEKLRLMKKYGVNRLSVGIQSFNDGELLKIGRIHNAQESMETVELIKKCGFDNFNLDLMSALPGQTFASFKDTLAKAVELSPRHVSCYSLIIEDGTPLAEEYKNGDLKLPDEDLERDMYDFACEYLKKNGYMQYEISNFAKVGFESRHNIKYWHCDEYIGIGISAHSYLGGVRFSNTSDINEYLRGEYRSGEYTVLSFENKIEEFVIMGLRMKCGIDKKEFETKFGYKIEDIYNEEIKKFVGYKLLEDNGKRIYLSRRGISLSNSVMCEFATCNLKKHG